MIAPHLPHGGFIGHPDLGLRARPGVLVGVARAVPQRDLVLAVTVALAWFGGIGALAASPYWYPHYLTRYWLAGCWIVGTLLLRRAAPVGAFWCTVLLYPVTYQSHMVNELHLVPLLVVASSVLLVRALHPALVVVLATASAVVLSLGCNLLQELMMFGGWELLLSFRYMSSFFDPWATATRVALVVAATVIGSVLGRLDETTRQLERRNAQLVALQEVRAREAVRSERTRIARELHDVVAHHVSAIVVRAQAADRVADTDPDEPREAVRWIAGSGREALDAMRTVVRVLRDDDPSARRLPDDGVGGPRVRPTGQAGAAVERRELSRQALTLVGATNAARQPTDTLSTLPAVLRRVRAAGLAVDADLPDPLPTLPPATGLAVLRVAQEALTNVLLHSAADRAELSLATTDAAVLLVVRDDGPARPGPSGGNGLVHMRERALAAGGTVHAGPAGSGWQVELTLPVGVR